LPTRFARLGLPVLAISVLLLLWQGAFGALALNPTLFPPPSAIGHAFVNLLAPLSHGVIPPFVIDIGISVARLVVAMAIAVTIGPLLGALMGSDRRLHGALAPVVNVLLPIPPYAYVPIMLLWLGQGERTIISTTALAAALPLIYTTTAGVRAIDRRQVWMLRSFGAGRIAILWRLVLPAAFSAIASGLRQSLAQGWRTLIGSEFLAAPTSGLGYLIFNARDFLAVNVMFAGLLMLGVLGFLSVYVMVDWIEDRTLVRWGLLRNVDAR
jgi:NitT/TauT family transport system permease protein